jgi:hypothetical protein
MPDDNMQVISAGLVIQRNKIPDYKFEGWQDCIETWQVWERKGLLPYPGSWRQQPADVWDILKWFDDMYAIHTAAEAEMKSLMSKSKARR